MGKAVADYRLLTGLSRHGSVISGDLAQFYYKGPGPAPFLRAGIAACDPKTPGKSRSFLENGGLSLIFWALRVSRVRTGYESLFSGCACCGRSCRLCRAGRRCGIAPAAQPDGFRRHSKHRALYRHHAFAIGVAGTGISHRPGCFGGRSYPPEHQFRHRINSSPASRSAVIWQLTQAMTSISPSVSAIMTACSRP